ncbi:TetR/AcrR family transcriptional regulator [Williamsia deligens]|uniref:TetR/AcrR family transcriptional regulator n=1 Tax=Williamsia deligens TaxID=321325 RepID=A0ABW3GBM1_9NOCA|nr:TetR/AcrR family transcriptional regulator [Williamsia deligens]MCP2193049.1 transcriptional regulator, TetR family [Williamsia deligens]
MPATTSRHAYLETGLGILADRGYGGLKLAEVCRRLGVTSGSFYHFFPNWGAYTSELIEHWRSESNTALIEHVRSEPNPRRRIDILRGIAMSLPYHAEAAIRTWSSLDPEVRAVQQAVDASRYEVLVESAEAIMGDRRRAEYFAKWSMYLLVGYEQITLDDDPDALQWLFARAEEALDTHADTDR